MNSAVFYRRCIFLCLVFVAGLSALSVRLIYLHVVKADEVAKQSIKSSKSVVLLANRGCIVDCNNQLIARNSPRARMAFDKLRLHDTGMAALALANKELRETPEWDLWDQKKRDRKVEDRAGQLKKKVQADARALANKELSEAPEWDHGSKKTRPRSQGASRRVKEELQDDEIEPKY